MKRPIQKCHISKLSEYEKALAKGRISSVDENPNAPKKAQINNIISRLSRSFTQTGVDDKIYELIPNSELCFIFVWDKNFIEFLPYLQPTVKPSPCDNVPQESSGDEGVLESYRYCIRLCVCVCARRLATEAI